MSPPPLMLGAGLLFWGWQSGSLAAAVPMALALEASRFVSWRWEFSDKELNRVADLTNLLFAGAAVLLFSRHGPHGVYAIVRWLPALLFLLVAAQIYSSRGDLSLGTLFLSVRQHEKRGGESTGPRIDLTYPYFSACVIAAGVAAYETAWFFPGVVLLTIWGLSHARPRRYPFALWAGLLVLVGALGYAGQWGIWNLQRTVEDLVLSWFQDRLWSDTDPYRARTAIGHIGRLKFSDRVVFQVETDGGNTRPLLLRQATYHDYRAGAWHSDGVGFEPLTRGDKSGEWLLAEGTRQGASVRIAGPLRKGRGILPLPGGTRRIEGLAVPVLKSNPYGAVKLDDGPGFVSYAAHFAPTSTRDRAPIEADLRVPSAHRVVIEQIADQLTLQGQPFPEVVRRLAGFFRGGFRYSLVQKDGLDDLPPLTHFLLHGRKGHCEYFATATVFLLRAAGFPSRYATGYSVQEAGFDDNLFVVRERHGHAWALAYVNGAWVDVDLTPAVWAGLEEAAAPWWLPAYDLFSRAAFGVHRWRWGREGEAHTGLYLALLAPLAILLGWRLYRQKRAQRTMHGHSGQGLEIPRVGEDSDFYRIVHHLEKTQPSRQPGETLRHWLTRLGHSGSSTVLRDALDLHYRHRFDPDGLGESDRARMRRLVNKWLGGRGTRNGK